MAEVEEPLLHRLLDGAPRGHALEVHVAADQVHAGLGRLLGERRELILYVDRAHELAGGLGWLQQPLSEGCAPRWRHHGRHTRRLGRVHRASHAEGAKGSWEHTVFLAACMG